MNEQSVQLAARVAQLEQGLNLMYWGARHLARQLAAEDSVRHEIAIAEMESMQNVVRSTLGYDPGDRRA